MTKYNLSFKQQVIDFYLQYGKNRSLTRQHFQLAESTLKRWIKQYNHNRINGLSLLGKKRGYSPEFKLFVIQAVNLSKFFTTLFLFYQNNGLKFNKSRGLINAPIHYKDIGRNLENTLGFLFFTFN